MAMAQLHYRQTQVTIEHRERETAMFYAFFSLFFAVYFFRRYQLILSELS